MKFLYILLPLLFILNTVDSSAQEPPYSGTIFINPDIITETSRTAFLSITPAGRGERMVFDRRTNKFESINAYLFDVVWDDGLTTEAIVNPEFESEANALIEADKYARIVGQLPNCLRIDVDGIWIQKGIHSFGGGNRSILIHTGQSELYDKDGILEETLVHEAAHTSLDQYHAEAQGWLDAQKSDVNFISTYAKDNPLREDVAESFLTWLMVRYRSNEISTDDYDKITEAIPNRLTYFDGLGLNLYPFEVSASVNGFENNFDLSLSPNPVVNKLNIGFGESIIKGNIIVLSLDGRELSRYDIMNQNELQVDFNYKAGVYFIKLVNGKHESVSKVIKY